MYPYMLPKRAPEYRPWSVKMGSEELSSVTMQEMTLQACLQIAYARTKPGSMTNERWAEIYLGTKLIFYVQNGKLAFSKRTFVGQERWYNVTVEHEDGHESFVQVFLLGHAVNVAKDRHKIEKRITKIERKGTELGRIGADGKFVVTSKPKTTAPKRAEAYDPRFGNDGHFPYFW